MSLLGLVNTTTNLLLAGAVPPSKAVAPPNLPPVTEPRQPQTANRDASRDAAGLTLNPASKTLYVQSAETPASAQKIVGSVWAGQMPPSPDTGGVSFDFSPAALEKAGLITTSAPELTTVAANLNKTQADAPATEAPVSVTGKTMVRVESDEDRVRAWAIGALRPERITALPLSLVTDATAIPPAQAGSISLDGSSMAAIQAELASTPSRVLARV